MPQKYVIKAWVEQKMHYDKPAKLQLILNILNILNIFLFMYEVIQEEN